MPKFKIPTIAEIMLVQNRATRYVCDALYVAGGARSFVLLEKDVRPDTTKTNVIPATQAEYKVVTSVRPGSSPEVAILVYVGSYDGSASYGEWMYLDDDDVWHSSENWADLVSE